MSLSIFEDLLSGIGSQSLYNKQCGPCIITSGIEAIAAGQREAHGGADAAVDEDT